MSITTTCWEAARSSSPKAFYDGEDPRQKPSIIPRPEEAGGFVISKDNGDVVLKPYKTTGLKTYTTTWWETALRRSWPVEKPIASLKLLNINTNYGYQECLIMSYVIVNLKQA